MPGTFPSKRAGQETSREVELTTTSCGVDGGGGTGERETEREGGGGRKIEGEERGETEEKIRNQIIKNM